MKQLLLLIAITTILGCHQSHAGGTQDTQRTDESEYPWMKFCITNRYPDTWVDTVISDARATIRNVHDGCVLIMIDSLQSGIISGRCLKCMEAFNAVVKVSDGYVGEYVTGVCGELYYNSFSRLWKFIADPDNDAEEMLDHLSWSFYYEISADAAPEQRREEIIRDIQLKMLGRTTPEKKLLERLIQKVREIKAD